MPARHALIVAAVLVCVVGAAVRKESGENHNDRLYQLEGPEIEKDLPHSVGQLWISCKPKRLHPCRDKIWRDKAAEEADQNLLFLDQVCVLVHQGSAARPSDSDLAALVDEHEDDVGE